MRGGGGGGGGETTCIMVYVKMVNYIFTLSLYMFLGSSFFLFFSHLRELVPPLVASIMGEFKQTL